MELLQEIKNPKIKIVHSKKLAFWRILWNLERQAYSQKIQFQIREVLRGKKLKWFTLQKFILNFFQEYTKWRNKQNNNSTSHIRFCFTSKFIWKSKNVKFLMQYRG